MKNVSLLVTMLTAMLLCTACVGNEGKDNPLNISELKIHWKEKNAPWVGFFPLDYITIETPDGELKYSDEDAELYYDEYALIFTWAVRIADDCNWQENVDYMEIKDYLENNLLEIVCNLPLDDSYPENIREFVNSIYYNNVDDIMKLSLADRGYGYKKYYYNKVYNEYYNYHSGGYCYHGLIIRSAENDVLEIGSIQEYLN